MADRRRRDVQLLGRLGDTKVARYRLEGAEGIEGGQPAAHATLCHAHELHGQTCRSKFSQRTPSRTFICPPTGSPPAFTGCRHHEEGDGREQSCLAADAERPCRRRLARGPRSRGIPALTAARPRTQISLKNILLSFAETRQG